MPLKRPMGYRAKELVTRKRILQKFLMLLILLTLLGLVVVLHINLRNQGGNERRELRSLFESGEYEGAYLLSSELLSENPLDFFLLTAHGYSAYQLAIAQINSFYTFTYLDDCIWSLRKALLVREDMPEVHYVLGKAYYHKGSFYVDLAITYLEQARTASFLAADIPEYLGLSYALVGDYRSSIEAFSLALSGEYSNNSPSEDLLMDIARSYRELGENESAVAYLRHCIAISRDSSKVAEARLLLAGTIFDTGNHEEAEAEFLLFLEENGDNAEAFFMLGEIYLSRGDTTRARAEWRRAYNVDRFYPPARNRLSL